MWCNHRARGWTRINQSHPHCVVLCLVNSFSLAFCGHRLYGYSSRGSRFFFQPSPENAWPDSWVAHIWARARHWREDRRREEKEEEEQARAMWLMLVNSIYPCPGINAASADIRRLGHTQTGTKARLACRHSYTCTHAHACRARNTQTNKRLTCCVCHLAAAPVSMATAGTMQ